MLRLLSNMASQLFWNVGCTSGCVAVLLGAFGAHALKTRFPPQTLEIWNTAVQYQFFHSLALLMAVKSGARTASLLFSFGIVVFSGSLYSIALTGIKKFGAITPIGGLAFAAGWIALAYEAKL